MAERSLLIIGGGIAGLSAGCYGQMNGFRTRILEMHRKPGGLCTSWKRGGYVVDGCIHWLVGSGPSCGFHRMWRELGAVQEATFVDPVEYGRIEDRSGNRFIVHTDLDRLEHHMREIAPEDGAVIDEFIGAVRRCTRFDLPWEKAPEVSGFFDVVKLIVRFFPLLRTLGRWNRVTLRDFGLRFRNPLLREAFPRFFLPEFPVSFMLMTFAWMHNRTAGYPLGGSLAFSRSIERRYRGLGGEITYQARVSEILVRNDRAIGVRLENGSELFGDHVISAADSHSTIFGMLKGRYVDRTVRGYFDTLIPFPPLVHVALGVHRLFPELPPSASGMSFELGEPLMVGGTEHRYLGMRAFAHDPGLAPAGRTLVTVLLQTDYDFWTTLRADDARYRFEKERIADRVVVELDRRFPGLASQVEMRDVATPATFERYTGNWRGSFEGWQVTPATWSFGRVMKKTLPGLGNFSLCGQWVEPGGGLPAAALSGRNAIQIICKKEKRTFLAFA